MTDRAGRLSRVATAAAVIILAAVLVPLGAPHAAAWTRSPVRVAGDDRYATTVALSQIVFPSGAATVFVASGEAFPDALAGGAAAGATESPLLLTGSTVLPDVVADELRRLHPTDVEVLGGPAAISDQVVAEIRDTTGVTPSRLAGLTRYDTAAAVAARFAPGGAVFVATGDGFADGLAGGPAAGVARSPMLLVKRDAVPAASRAQLQRLQPSRIVVLGGAGVVSDAVVAALGAFSPNVERVAGADRFGTAAAIAREFFPHPPEAWLVSGTAFPDALGAGPAATVFGTPLVLTLPACAPPATAALLQSLEWPNVTVIGGSAAVSDAAGAVEPCSPVPDGPIAPGVRLDTVVTDGPNVVRIITIDRTQGVDIRSTLATGQLVGRLPATEIARRWNAIVGVNGDFFLNDGQPGHLFATGGRIIKAPAGIEDEIAFSATDARTSFSGTPHLAMTATVAETGAVTTIDRVNDGDPSPDEVALYTPEGSTAASPPSSGVCGARLTPTAAPQLAASGAAVQLHAVVAKGCGPAAPTADGNDLLVATSSGSRGAFLASLLDGQHVTIGWLVDPQWTDVLDAIGSNTTLVHNSVPSDDVVNGDGPFYSATAPRTAAGQLPDGRDVLVTVDGRQPGYSAGMTPLEFAQFLASLGVAEAVNLDGGGSTTLTVGGLLVNRPSDFAGERAVGSAVVVVPAGTPDPPPFTGAATAPPPQPDLALTRDAGSLGGYAATLAARGAPMSPELAAVARDFNR